METTITNKKWDFSLIDELDTVLNWFALWENRGMERTFEYIYDTLKTIRFKDYQGYNKDIAGIIRVCINKLVKDGFVSENKEWVVINMNTGEKTFETRYGITFEGLLFIETKVSYRLEYKSLGVKIEADKNYRIRAECAANQLNYLTAFVGIATAALGTSEMIKVYSKEREYFCLYVEILSIAATIILLTMWVRKSNRKS